MTEQFVRALAIYNTAHDDYMDLCERLDAMREEVKAMEKLLINKKAEAEAAWRVVADMIGG